MTQTCPTVKVKSDAEDTGGFIVINESDFDAAVHERFDEGGKKADPGKPSEGLKVDDLKAALEAKGIPIPEGAKKADLQVLLDQAA